MGNNLMKSLGAKGSVIRELFEYGNLRKKIIGEDNVFDYSIGNPSIPTPQIVTDTLIDLLSNVDPVVLHGYTSAAGDYNVRKAICDYLNRTYEIEEKPELVYMTVGAAASLTITFKALLNPGDEVIVFAPFFPEYRVFVENAGGKLVVAAPDDANFYPDFEELERLITDKTKIIVINSPNNPTGVVYPEDVIKKISLILENKQEEYQHDIYLVSDEPYRELVYSDIKYPFVTKYYQNTIVCYSFSKSLSLPGERIGYILVSSKCHNGVDLFTAVCGAGRSLGFVCAPSLFQKMIPACLGYTGDLAEYKINRDLLYNSLTAIGYEVAKPDGAFYLFVKALEPDANQFSEYAKKYELLLVPSDSFGYSGYVRVAYCVKRSMIEKSLKSFEQLYQDYKNNEVNHG